MAALSGGREQGQVDFSTLGLRWGWDLRANGQQTAWLRLHGALGRRFASGDRQPQATLNWRGGEAFTISGLAVAKQTTVAALGVTARVSRNGLLYFGYEGTFAHQLRDQSLQVRGSLRF